MENIKEIIANVSAERAIISILLKNIDNLIICSSENLYSEHFAIEINQVLYSVICYLSEQGVKNFDSNTIYSTIQDENAKKQLDEFGGRDYIDTLLQSTILEENLKVYIKQVIDCSMKRFMYSLGKDMQLDAIKIKDVSEMITTIQKKVLDISLSSVGDSEVKQLGTDAKDRLRARADNPRAIYGYMIGWSKYDKITQGASPNDLIVFVAPSKTGKSTLLTNMAKKLSIDGDLTGLYIDTEMLTEEQEDRLIAIVSEVPYEEIRNGMFAQDTPYGLGSEKQERVYKAIDLIESKRLFHCYLPNFTVESTTALIRKYKIQEGIDYAIFDYIKLPSSDVKGLNSAQEYQRLGYFTTCLKDMAGICSIPIFTACQSNRADLDNTDPDASDIGGSYRILQLATKLMFLRNKTPRELEAEAYSSGNQVLHIKYQRNGSGDEKINLQFDRPILRMYEHS